MKWWNSLFPLLDSCWFCDTPVRRMIWDSIADGLCRDCRRQIERIEGPICVNCGRMWQALDSPLCQDCGQLKENERLPNRSVVVYHSLTKALLHRFKFDGDERLAIPFGRWMAEKVIEAYPEVPFSLITFVPAHADRLRERGFNQAELLAKEIGKVLSLPVSGLLIKRKATPNQSTQNRRDRLRSLSGAFQLAKEADQRHTILLVDDIYTTGTTVRECGKVLRDAGITKIYAITFARS